MPQRRWNADLHRRFVHAVEELGGEKEATPKNILRVMNVRGLTRTHVKSHLQVYRITKKEEKFQELIRQSISDRLTSQMNSRAVQFHLRQYALLREMAKSNQNLQRQKEEMHNRVTTIVSCKSLFQSSKIGLNETGNDEWDNGNGNNDGNNELSLSLELTLGIKN